MPCSQCERLSLHPPLAVHAAIVRCDCVQWVCLCIAPACCDLASWQVAHCAAAAAFPLRRWLPGDLHPAAMKSPTPLRILYRWSAHLMLFVCVPNPLSRWVAWRCTSRCHLAARCTMSACRSG